MDSNLAFAEVQFGGARFCPFRQPWRVPENVARLTDMHESAVASVTGEGKDYHTKKSSRTTLSSATAS